MHAMYKVYRYALTNILCTLVPWSMCKWTCTYAIYIQAECALKYYLRSQNYDRLNFLAIFEEACCLLSKLYSEIVQRG